MRGARREPNRTRQLSLSELWRLRFPSRLLHCSTLKANLYFVILWRASSPRVDFPIRLVGCLALPLFHSPTNSFLSPTPCALRMSAEAGSSFGARGALRSLRPASCGRRLPLREFTALLDQTRFAQASLPPRERGTTWSRLPSSGLSSSPVYWQRLWSRSRIVLAQSFGRFLGTLAKFTATMTVGTRIGPRTLWTALSCGRIGRVSHSSHATGRTLEPESEEWRTESGSDSGAVGASRSISRAVATLVAIMQKASWGVRTLMACQLRLRTRTVVLFSMFMTTVRASSPRLLQWWRCFFFVFLLCLFACVGGENEYAAV